jgi:molybdate transport system regulatory protein
MSLRPHARLRLLLGEDIAFGPGKADLLEAIRRTGSISAAAKALDMSYRRAWLLVETMNACFDEPLVNSTKGGSGGGGAEVTAAGEELLVHYRKLQREVDAVLNKHLPSFERKARKQQRKAR